MNLVLDRDRESWLCIAREANERGDLEYLVRAIERQETRPLHPGDIRELRQQECRRRAEIGCFRDDGEQLGEPLSRQLGYSP